MAELLKIDELFSLWTKGISLYSKWAAKYKIGYPEMMVLYALKTREKSTQKEISENFGLFKQTVNTVVRKLKNENLITFEKSAKDGREKIIFLTSERKIYADKLIYPLLNAEKNINKQIGDERLEQTIETMELFNLLFEKEFNKVGNEK